MDPEDDLARMSREQLEATRQYEYFNGGNQRRENDQLQLLSMLGGNIDAYGLQVPESQSRGQQEFNRLATGDALTRPQQNYLRTRQVTQNAQREHLSDPTFEREQLPRMLNQQLGIRAPTMRMPPKTVQGNFDPKRGQAMAFAKALGLGQMVTSPESNDLAYKAMDMMLRRTPLPVLLHPQRKQRTQAEFQALLESLSQPMNNSRMPVQP